jgi:hypothetical protein
MVNLKYRIGILIFIVLCSYDVKAQVITPGQIDLDYYRMLHLKQDSITLIPHFLDAALYDVPRNLQFDIWGRYQREGIGTTASSGKADIRILPVTFRLPGIQLMLNP